MTGLVLETAEEWCLQSVSAVLIDVLVEQIICFARLLQLAQAYSANSQLLGMIAMVHRWIEMQRV